MIMLQFILLFTIQLLAVQAFTILTTKNYDCTSSISSSRHATSLLMKSPTTRRDAFVRVFTLTSLISTTIITNANSNPANAAVEVASGSSEKLCREKGNCLEVGELDGAIGWNW